MKKLLVLGLIALQGVSLIAMSENGTLLEGDALRYFHVIVDHANDIKAEVVQDFLKRFPELAHAKTNSGVPLIVHIASVNNPGLMEVLLEYKADLTDLVEERIKDQAVQDVVDAYKINPGGWVCLKKKMRLENMSLRLTNLTLKLKNLSLKKGGVKKIDPKATLTRLDAVMAQKKVAYDALSDADKQKVDREQAEKQKAALEELYGFIAADEEKDDLVEELCGLLAEYEEEKNTLIAAKQENARQAREQEDLKNTKNSSWASYLNSQNIIIAVLFAVGGKYAYDYYFKTSDRSAKAD